MSEDPDRPSASSEATVGRTRFLTRLRRLGDTAADDDYVERLSPEARMALVWPLSLQAWGFKEALPDEPRLRRDVVRVVRRRR